MVVLAAISTALKAFLSNIQLILIGSATVAILSLYLLWSNAASDRDAAQLAAKALTEQLADFTKKQTNVNENIDTRAKEEVAVDEAIAAVKKKLEHDHPEAKTTPISPSTRDALEWLRNNPSR